MVFKWLRCFNVVACSCTSGLCQWTWEWRKIWTISWSDSSKEKTLAWCWRRRRGSRITSRRKGRTRDRRMRTVSEGRRSTRQNLMMVHQRRSERLLGGGYLGASCQLAKSNQSQNRPFLTALPLWLAHLLKFCLTCVFVFFSFICVSVFFFSSSFFVIRTLFFLAQLSSVARHGHSNTVSEFDHVQLLEFPVHMYC